MKDFLIWHVGTYGDEPTELEPDRVEEYLEEIEAERTSRQIYEPADLANVNVRRELVIHSPSLDLILRLKAQQVSLEKVHWRDFEKLIAELLAREGWTVELGKGSKDGGVDILASRLDPAIGPLLTVWQAKKLQEGNKVGLSTIRELADTRSELRASKAVIVTSSFLTRGALERVVKDEYTLGKVERPELLEWIQRYHA
jgi:restriction system protein